MINKLIAGIGALALSAMAVGCGGGSETVNTNMANANMANSNMANSNMTATFGGDARTAPDNSEIRTETVSGVTTETRTFRDPNRRSRRSSSLLAAGSGRPAFTTATRRLRSCPTRRSSGLWTRRATRS